MNEPLDEQYLKWLYGQVASVRLKNPARTYWSLARQLYMKEFVWLVPNDDNRVEDGRDLRLEFIEEREVEPDAEWMRFGCSVLEMMIGLSRKLAFAADEGDSRYWFWKMVENLGFREHSDLYYRTNSEHKVDVALERLIWRNYDPDGRGGLFPLACPDSDQRYVEIWYQMSYYLLEQE